MTKCMMCQKEAPDRMLCQPCARRQGQIEALEWAQEQMSTRYISAYRDRIATAIAQLREGKRLEDA